MKKIFRILIYVFAVIGALFTLLMIIAWFLPDEGKKYLENDINELNEERTTQPTQTREEIINEHKTQGKTIEYKELYRYIEKYENEYIKYTGEVMQIINGDLSTDLRVNINKTSYGYEDTIYVSYIVSPMHAVRFIEGDIINVYGKVSGFKTYTTVLGAETTIPWIFTSYLELVE